VHFLQYSQSFLVLELSVIKKFELTRQKLTTNYLLILREKNKCHILTKKIFSFIILQLLQCDTIVESFSILVNN